MSQLRRRTFLSNLRELAQTYELDEARILDTIEQVLARVLAVRYRRGQVVVRINERTLECDIQEYGQDGHIRILSIEQLTGVRNLEKHIMRALTEQAAVETAINLYRQYKKNVYRGEVRRITPSGSWWVDLYVSDSTTLVAECPATHQTEHDRVHVDAGKILPFHLSKIRVVDESRVQIIVDRRSRAVPEYLLTEELKKHRQEMLVTCRVRRVDKYCEVLAEKRVPRQILVTVAKALGEPLAVFYGDQEKIRACRQAKKHKSTTSKYPRVANQ